MDRPMTSAAFATLLATRRLGAAALVSALIAGSLLTGGPAAAAATTYPDGITVTAPTGDGSSGSPFTWRVTIDCAVVTEPVAVSVVEAPTVGTYYRAELERVNSFVNGVSNNCGGDQIGFMPSGWTSGRNGEISFIEGPWSEAPGHGLLCTATLAVDELDNAILLLSVWVGPSKNRDCRGRPLGGVDGSSGDGMTEGGSSGASSSSSMVVATAVEQADGLTGASGLLVRWNGAVVPLDAAVLPGAGSRGGLELSTDGLVVTLRSTGGATQALGVIVTPGGEVAVQICGGLAPGSVVEGHVYSDGPRLVGAVQVADDHGDADCVLLVLPFGAPLDGGSPISDGTHTLQLRMFAADGLEVVATVVAVGGPRPDSVPAGLGPIPTVRFLGVVALVASLGAAGMVGGLLGRTGRATR
jgi:hypothetical protein